MGLYDDLNFGKKKKPLKKIALIVLLLIICLVLLAKPTVNLVFSTVNFIQGFTKKTSNNLKLEAHKLLNKNKLIESQEQEIKALKKQIKSQKYQLQFFQASQANYKKQYRIRKLKSEKFPEAIETEVVSRSPSLWHQEVIINKGRAHGISLGNVAITTEGVIGQVSKVRENFSIVELISSRRVRFGANIKRTGVLGVIFGDRPGYANLKFVPIGSDVKVGDFVETTRTSPEKIKSPFPLFYPVGTITKIKRDSNNSELVIEVKLAESSFKLTDLLIVQPS